MVIKGYLMIEKLIIRRPDDWHLHFRDDEIMKAVVPFTASQFARAIVTNLTPPITTTARHVPIVVIKKPYRRFKF